MTGSANPIVVGHFAGARTQATFKAVIEYIRTRELRAGDSLPTEAQFCAELGVSRTVVREAFVALAAIGLIDIGNGRRARVGVINESVIELWLEHAVRTEQARVQQVWDVRRVVEERTAYLAAARRTEIEATHILGLAKRMREAYLAGDLTTQFNLDIEFHLAIAAAARNPVFATLVRAFRAVMQQTIPIGWRIRKTEAERVAMFDHHDRVAQAIAARQPQAAQDAMAEHFTSSMRMLVEAGLDEGRV